VAFGLDATLQNCFLVSTVICTTNLGAVYVEAFSPNGADQSFNHSNGCECPESFAESKQVSLKCYAWQNTVAVYTKTPRAA